VLVEDLSEVRQEWPAGLTIVVLDEHEPFAASLCSALWAQGFDAHRGAASSVRSILAAPAAGRGVGRGAGRGLMVVDPHLGRDTDGRWAVGLDLVRPLRARGWSVLVVTDGCDGHDEPLLAAAIAFGALGWLPRSGSVPALMSTVRTAVAGAPLLTAAQRQHWVIRHQRHRAHAEARLARLSPRERDTLTLLAAGHPAPVIAQRCVVSVTTVRTRIRAILNTLEVNSAPEAIALLGGQHRHLRGWPGRAVDLDADTGLGDIGKPRP
jgi:DNA-binding NarL/FixJ family response regulator